MIQSVLIIKQPTYSTQLLLRNLIKRLCRKQVGKTYVLPFTIMSKCDIITRLNGTLIMLRKLLGMVTEVMPNVFWSNFCGEDFV